MGQLIGTADTIEIPRTAKIKDGNKVIQVPFIAVYTRLTMTAKKGLQKRLNDRIHEATLLARDLAKVDLQPASGTEQAEMDSEELSAWRLAEKSRIEAEVERINQEATDELKKHLHEIKNLRGEDKKLIPSSPELIEEMLDYEPYFIELRDGLSAASGIVEEKKAKN